MNRRSVSAAAESVLAFWAEAGVDATDLDFSGIIPDSIMRIIGPAAGAPAVSIPAQFNVLRDGKSRIVFTGTPFAGNATDTMTVTLAARDGVFEAATGDGVTVARQDIARSFTGTLADLNRYFTNPGHTS